jgi:hypothetical protein
LCTVWSSGGTSATHEFRAKLLTQPVRLILANSTTPPVNGASKQNNMQITDTMAGAVLNIFARESRRMRPATISNSRTTYSRGAHRTMVWSQVSSHRQGVGGAECSMLVLWCKKSLLCATLFPSPAHGNCEMCSKSMLGL